MKHLFDDLVDKGLWVKFGLSPLFYSLSVKEKRALFKKAKVDYEKACCLKSSMIEPDKGEYFGEMCHSCLATAQILLYGYLNGYAKRRETEK